MPALVQSIHHGFYSHPLGFRLLQASSALRHPLEYWRRKRLALSLGNETDWKVDPELGFRFLEPGESRPVDAWVSALLQAADRQVEAASDRIESLKETAPNRFKIAFDLLSDERIARGSVLQRLLTEDSLLAAAAVYLKSAPVLRRVCIGVSPGSDRPWSGSQLFHLDGEGDSQLKLFVLMSDVLSEEDGPLTFLNRRTTQRVTEQLGLGPRGRVGSYTRAGPYPDQAVEPLIDPNEIRQLTGPRGRALLLDTCSVLHYGSRVAAGRTRWTLMASLQRHHRAFSTPSNRLISSEAAGSALRQLALNPAGRRKPVGYYFPDDFGEGHPMEWRGRAAPPV